MKKLILILIIAIFLLVSTATAIISDFGISGGYSTGASDGIHFAGFKWDDASAPINMTIFFETGHDFGGNNIALFINTSNVALVNISSTSNDHIDFIVPESAQVKGAAYWVTWITPAATFTEAFKTGQTGFPFISNSVSLHCNGNTAVGSDQNPLGSTGFNAGGCFTNVFRGAIKVEWTNVTPADKSIDNSSIISYWRFEEAGGNIIDYKGVANSTSSSGTIDFQKGGLFGNAINMSTNAFFNFGEGFGSTEAMHIFAGINVTNWSYLLRFRENTDVAGDQRGFFTGQSSDLADNFNVLEDNNNIIFFLRSQGTVHKATTPLNENPSNNVWHTLIITYDSEVGINMTLDARGIGNQTDADAKKPFNVTKEMRWRLNINSDLTTASETAYDDAAIFNIALNSSQIQDLVNTELINLIKGVPDQPPTFGDSSRNITAPNSDDVVGLSQVIEDDISLVGFKFAHNQSGTLVNSSLFPESSTSTNATFNLTVTLPAGRIISFEWWANDTSGNTAISALQTFTVRDSTAPTFGETSINISAPRLNQIVALSQAIVDDIELNSFRFSENSSGLFVNQSTKFISSDSFNASVNLTVTLTKGNVIGFQWWVNDTTDNIGITSIGTFTVGNTPPEIPTILFPTADLITNLQPLDLNVTFPADIDGDAITITYYINGTINATSSGNVTFTAADGNYVLNVDLNDGFDSSAANATVSFRLDTTNPIITILSPLNGTIHSTNISVNLTAFDNNIFLLNYTFFNSSNDIIRSIENSTNISVAVNGVLTIKDIIPIDDLPDGVFTLNVTAADLHTARQIPEYVVTPSPSLRGLQFLTAEGNDIIIDQVIGRVGVPPNARRRLDRYEVNFGTFPILEPRVYNITAANGRIFVVKNSNFKGHLVIFSEDGHGGNWIDFESADPDSLVFAQSITDQVVTVIVFSTDFNFNSIGALNVVTESITLTIDTTVPPSPITGLAVLPLESVSNLVGMVVLLLIVIGVIFGVKRLGGKK